MRIRSQQDFWSGLLFMALGAAFALKARDYPMGNAAQMGAGYLPFWLGLCLALLGAFIAARALGARTPPDAIARFNWRILASLCGSFALFGISLNTLGLFPSLGLLIGLSSLACPHVPWKAVAANAIFLMLFSWLVFVKGLGLIFPLWPAWLAG